MPGLVYFKHFTLNTWVVCKKCLTAIKVQSTTTCFKVEVTTEILVGAQ